MKSSEDQECQNVSENIAESKENENKNVLHEEKKVEHEKSATDGGIELQSEENAGEGNETRTEECETGEPPMSDYNCRYLRVIVAAIRAKGLLRESKSKGVSCNELSLVKTKYVKSPAIALSEIKGGKIFYNRRQTPYVGNIYDEAEKRKAAQDMEERQV